MKQIKDDKNQQIKKSGLSDLLWGIIILLILLLIGYFPYKMI
jgi:hypothetical protein